MVKKEKAWEMALTAGLTILAGVAILEIHEALERKRKDGEGDALLPGGDAKQVEPPKRSLNKSTKGVDTGVISVPLPFDIFPSKKEGE